MRRPPSLALGLSLLWLSSALAQPDPAYRLEAAHERDGEVLVFERATGRVLGFTDDLQRTLVFDPVGGALTADAVEWVDLEAGADWPSPNPDGDFVSLGWEQTAVLDRATGCVYILQPDLRRHLRLDLPHGRAHARPLPPDPALDALLGREAAERAVEYLRSLDSVQSIFRETDREGDGDYDYATLPELLDTDMIAAPDLGEYYTIDCAPGAEAPQYLWMAIARPTRPGLPTYAVNQRGQVVLVPDGAIELNPTAELPSHAEPVQ